MMHCHVKVLVLSCISLFSTLLLFQLCFYRRTLDSKLFSCNCGWIGKIYVPRIFPEFADRKLRNFEVH